MAGALPALRLSRPDAVPLRLDRPQDCPCAKAAGRESGGSSTIASSASTEASGGDAGRAVTSTNPSWGPKDLARSATTQPRRLMCRALARLQLARPHAPTRTEERLLPDHYPRSRCKLGPLDLRRPITVAAGTAIAAAPRTDPGERNYGTKLLPRVMASNRQSGQGCRSFGLGSRRSAIRIIFRHVSRGRGYAAVSRQKIGADLLSPLSSRIIS